MSNNDSSQVGKSAEVESKVEPIPARVKEAEVGAQESAKKPEILKLRVKDEFGETVLYECTNFNPSPRGLSIFFNNRLLAHYNKWSNHIIVSE